MEYLVLFITVCFANYLVAEWNLLIGKTYLENIQDKKTNRESFRFLLIMFLYFCLWPIRTTCCGEPEKYYLWQTEEGAYKFLMTIGGSTLKILLNPIFILGIFISYWILLLSSAYIIPEIKHKKT